MSDINKRTGKRRNLKVVPSGPPPAPADVPHLNGDGTKILIERLSAMITERKTNARAVSRSAGLTDTYCHDVINQRNTKPSVLAIVAIARVLNTTLAFLMGEEDDTSKPKLEMLDTMPLLATAETGVFRAMQETEPVRPQVHAQRFWRHPNATHFAVQVAGDCMNARVGSPPLLAGMTALCVDMVSAGLIAESSRIYCVRRTLDNGASWETILRRAEVFRDRTLLWADSTNPQFKEPIVLRKPLPICPAVPWTPNARQPICAIGLVYGAMISFE